VNRRGIFNGVEDSTEVDGARKASSARRAQRIDERSEEKGANAPTNKSRALLRTKGAPQWRSTPLKRALPNHERVPVRLGYDDFDVAPELTSQDLCQVGEISAFRIRVIGENDSRSGSNSRENVMVSHLAGQK
jgi:hypothetical protein